MVPPLVRRSDPERVHVCGFLPLTEDERARIDLFLDRVEAEYGAEVRRARPHRQYIITPHTAPFTDHDGTVLFQRYSCGGLVIEAYKFAGINLLMTDGTVLPLVTLNLLRIAYPDYADDLSNTRRRALFGLDGEGPWPIVLAGYLLHSLSRLEGEIRAGPYQAHPGDEYYPSRPPVPPTAQSDTAA
jgi:hypothetical protein